MAWSGAITLRDSVTDTSSTRQSMTSASFTPAADSLLFVQAGSVQGFNDAYDFQISNTGGLTFTPYATSVLDFGSNDFQGATFVASVGGSPSAMTVTVDPYSGTGAGWMSMVVFDVTDASLVQTPVVRAETDGGGSSETHTTGTLGSTTTSGNLVIAGFSAHNDGGGGAPATPAGWTALASQSAVYQMQAVFYRTDFAGTSVTCSDLGQLTQLSGSYIYEIETPSGGTPHTVSPVDPVGVTDLVVSSSVSIEHSYNVRVG